MDPASTATAGLGSIGLGIDQDTMDMARHSLQVLGTEEGQDVTRITQKMGWFSKWGPQRITGINQQLISIN